MLLPNLNWILYKGQNCWRIWIGISMFKQNYSLFHHLSFLYYYFCNCWDTTLCPHYFPTLWIFWINCCFVVMQQHYNNIWTNMICRTRNRLPSTSVEFDPGRKSGNEYLREVTYSFRKQNIGRCIKYTYICILIFRPATVLYLSPIHENLII